MTIYKPRSLRLEERYHQKLYELERARTKAVMNAAMHLGRELATFGIWDSKEPFFARTLPQELYDTLEAFESTASCAAAAAYLEDHGYTVTKTGPDTSG